MSDGFLDLHELDESPAQGLIMKGWDFSQAEVMEALKCARMLNPAVELCSNVCPWNCDFCFTEAAFSDRKRRLSNELSLDAKKKLVSELSALGARSINIVGAGEPTIDPNFFEIIEYIDELGMVPIIYTEGSLKLSDKAFCERVYRCNATVVLKVNSLFDSKYQNSILLSGDKSPKPPKYDYFSRRQLALQNMLECGFNSTAPTRLAFDTIICRENIGEIERLHRFARDNNIFVLLVNYLPSGRSASGHTNEISKAEQFEMFRKLAAIDHAEYGISQRGIFPYAGSQPCLIRGTGLFIKVNGDVLACPGETTRVGTILEQPLAEIWSALKDVRAAFDGHCPPRERFWAIHEQAISHPDD